MPRRYGTNGLTAKQLKFVLAFEGQGTAAARAAGYSIPAKDAFRLMRQPHIRKAVEEKMANVLVASAKRLGSTMTAADPPPKLSPRSGPAFIYLIKCGDFYKIGIAISLETRLSNIQTQNPDCVELIASCHSSNAFQEEKTLHRIFRDRRVRGEWFKLTENDLLLLHNFFASSQVDAK